MQFTLVSAVITTHNRLSLLPRAIESVLSQTYPNIECIVVSDASMDGTAEYCSSRTDIRFINIPKEESKGGNHARNEGIKAAKGEYIAFLDDDDYWLPTKIEKQIALIEEKKCDLVYCGLRPEIPQRDGNSKFVDWLPLADGQGDLSVKILARIYLMTSGIMIRKSLFDRVGLFDENIRYWQEYELSIRMAQETKFYAVNECLYVYRMDGADPNRLTNKYHAWKDSARYIHRKHASLYKKASLPIRIDAWRLYYGEAVNRGRKNGLHIEPFLYKIIAFTLKRIRMFIK